MPEKQPFSASVSADRLVYYLVQKIQTGTDKQKLGAISILRHLVGDPSWWDIASFVWRSG